jgi:hypothetical protein
MKIGMVITLALIAVAIVLVINGQVDFDRSRQEVCRSGPLLTGTPRGQSRFDHLVCR